MYWDNDARDTQTQLVYDYFVKTLDKELMSELKKKGDVELAKWIETNFWSHTYEYHYDHDFADLFPQDSKYFKCDHLRDTLFELVSLLEINFHLIAERLLNE